MEGWIGDADCVDVEATRGVAELYLFDTFTGMTEAGPQDVDIHGDHADSLMKGKRGEEIAALVKAEAGLENVRAAIQSTGYDMRLVHLVEGDVRQTLKKTSTLQIALLRLDTEFYDSTLAELEILYPRLSRGGIMIIDDYGHWAGAKQAVDEYFSKGPTGPARPMFWVIDYTGRGAVKLGEAERVEMERYDYIPPGMTAPNLLPLFPFAEPGNPWAVDWPYLRKEVPHIWRSDTRHKGYVTAMHRSKKRRACMPLRRNSPEAGT